MYETFIDLDELILKCRDKKSQILIKEAVACYRAGAFRSCIVSTWNAVVFDFLHKMRELELFGDGNAKELLEKFENLRNNHDLKGLWMFESAIPKRAVEDFELISTLEQSDIQRLLDDRNRCAHPSMISSEEPFEATAELARYHLRSAITHLLARPPVQGRKAKERLFEDIKSQYFPIDKEKAKVYLQNSPLSRARFTLVKDIVLGLTTSLLTDDFEEQENLRQFAALTAISEMYHEYTYKILDEDLSKIILNKVSDDNWGKVIIYLGTITTWNNLNEQCKFKAISYIENINIWKPKYNLIRTLYQLSENALTILFKASHISFLRESVINKLTTISMKDILSIKNICNDSFFNDQILIPIIKERCAEASLNELVSIFSEPSLQSDANIRLHIENKVKESSFAILINELKTVININDQDKWLVNLIKSELPEKIEDENLENLLRLKNMHLSMIENQSLLELFNQYINNKWEANNKNMSCDEIFSLIRYCEDDEFPINLITIALEERLPAESLENLVEFKRNKSSIINLNSTIANIFENIFDKQIKDKGIEPIINLFENSKSFDSASYYANIFLKFAKVLSIKQWEKILIFFIKNNQNYNSWSCCATFEKLFMESYEIHNFVLPYWYDFRKELNKFNNNNINNLKSLIDDVVNNM